MDAENRHNQHKESHMKTLKDIIPTGVFRLIALAACSLVSADSPADTVNVVWNSPTAVPITVSGYTASGNTVNFTLNFAPAPGTELMVVKNTALGFINGTFDNLGGGQQVSLSYGGITYDFVANYYGGSGNDLVLAWAHNHAFAWGQNYYGDLGNNTTAQSLVPAAMDMTSASALYGKTVVGIAAGDYHSLVLCADGTLAACGDNEDGELGDGTVMDRAVPVGVNTNSGSALYGKTVVAIATGGLHSLALCSDGTVAAWGDNLYGQLGDNTTTERLTPVAVNSASGVSALYRKTVVAIAAGDGHSLALCSDGTVVAWGLNYDGQLGDNQASGSQSRVPVAVNSASGISALYGKTVVAIAAGADHSVALCSDGTVAAWGENNWGQLGDNQASGSQSLVPVAVNASPGSALYGKTAVAIAAAYGHNLALCSDGTVAAWGLNDDGQLGDNQASGSQSLVPVSVNMASGVSALYGKTVAGIAAGEEYSLALCSDRTVVAWGLNSLGQLGDKTTTTRPVPVAVDTSPLSSGQCFTRVAGGSMAEHTLALVADPLPPLYLQAQPGAGTLTLQWPTNYSGFIPQANSVLANTTGWADLAGTPVPGGSNCSLTLPSTNAACFFRLRSP